MKFEDGSTRKNIKSVYTKLKIGLVEDETKPQTTQQNKANKINPSKKLQASNQNDILKFTSSHFQAYCLKFDLNEENGQCYPKFRYFKEITEKIVKKKDFPKFLENFVDYLNLEITNFKKNSLGVFHELLIRGYSQKTIYRFITVVNHLIFINNHKAECPICKNLFVQDVNFIDEIMCDFLNSPDLQKKIIKTPYSNWVDLIRKTKCQGFDSLISDESFKISASSKRIEKGKNQKIKMGIKNSK